MAIDKTTKKRYTKKQRQRRVRSRIFGTPDTPRLNVSRTLTGMFLQLIDDIDKKTIVSVNSKKDVKKGDVGERKGKEAESYLLGKALAEKASKMNIKKAVFDRAGFKYHGRVKAAAEGARDGGLVF